ncbi:MAG: hypothetical protein CVU09_03970 [Bacteroidetes bacterium HGW-Bacteroidetes-4]|jgi:O-antigen/teichoic acid export membrane protein|nr:MAG: hypothetical protein CVU09_03970 [Bacteroidetes bacterium HGW-Bacteroidetes-4]
MHNRLISHFNKIINDPFWRNVATLFSGSAIAQALPILILPVITRLYSKEALGFYFVYAAIGMLTQIVASLNFELAIIIPKEKKEANTVTQLSYITVGFVSLMMLGLIVFVNDYISIRITQKAFVYLIYAIPLSAFLLGVFNVSIYYLNRQNKYRIIATGKILKAVTFTLSQVVFGFMGNIPSGLIIGLIIGQFISALYLIYKVFADKHFIFTCQFSNLLKMVRKYRDMPVFNTLISVIGTLSNQLPFFFLSKYFGVVYSGEYGLANRVVSTPMGLIGTSIGQVFYKEAADVVNKKGNLYHLVKTTYLRLLKIAFLPFLILFFLSPWLFPFLFSNEYQVSGQMTQVLIPWLFMSFLNSPMSYLFDVLNKQRFMAVFHVTYLITRVGGLFLGYYWTKNALITVAIFSAIGFLFNIYIIIYYLSISKQVNIKTYHIN